MIPRLCAHSPLTEGVQAGQHFGVLVAVQTYAADQELFVNLAYHRAGESGAFTGHPKSLGSLNLSHRTLPSETGLNFPARDPCEVGGVKAGNSPNLSKPVDYKECKQINLGLIYTELHRITLMQQTSWGQEEASFMSC